MSLAPVEIVNGFFSVLIVVIAVYVGLLIALRYFKTKETIYLYVGFTWALMVEAWYPNAISFFPVLILGGPGIPDVIFFIIGNVLYPVATILWMKAVTDLFYQENQRLIMRITVIACITIEVVFFILLAVQPSLIGQKRGPIDADYELFMTIFQVSLIFLFLYTGIKFGKETIKSDDPERVLKGKLLIFSLLIFVVGALLDAVGKFLEFLDVFYTIILVIARILLILSAIGFYGAFLLPDWMKKRFLK